MRNLQIPIVIVVVLLVSSSAIAQMSVEDAQAKMLAQQQTSPAQEADDALGTPTSEPSAVISAADIANIRSSRVSEMDTRLQSLRSLWDQLPEDQRNPDSQVSQEISTDTHERSRIAALSNEDTAAEALQDVIRQLRSNDEAEAEGTSTLNRLDAEAESLNAIITAQTSRVQSDKQANAQLWNSGGPVTMGGGDVPSPPVGLILQKDQNQARDEAQASQRQLEGVTRDQRVAKKKVADAEAHSGALKQKVSALRDYLLNTTDSPTDESRKALAAAESALSSEAAEPSVATAPSVAVAHSAAAAPSETTLPVVKGINVIPLQVEAGTDLNWKFDVEGANFGYHAAFVGNSPDIRVTDISSNGWVAGTGQCTVGLNVTSWTDSNIKIEGYTGAYGGPYTARPGDTIQIKITNSISGRESDAYNVTLSLP